jgi:hypothetical protein
MEPVNTSRANLKPKNKTFEESWSALTWLCALHPVLELELIQTHVSAQSQICFGPIFLDERDWPAPC